MPGNPTIVFPEPRRVVIEDRDRPSPGEGEVLIRTRRTLISTGTELTILSGSFPEDSAWSRYGRFPFVPGYNNVGVVEEVGKGVDQSLVGRTVASHGSHAAYVVAPADQVLPVPDAIPEEQAAFFTMACIAMNSLRRAPIQYGQAVAIYGLGLLGQLCVQLCRLCGARPIVAIDVAEFRLNLLPTAPYIVPVNPQTDDPVETVRRATRGRMADVVFEVTGAPDLIPREFALLKRQGRFVVLSSPRGPTSFDFHDLCNAPSFTIIGAHVVSHPEHETPDNPWTRKRHGELFFDLLSYGDIDVARLMTHRVPFTQGPEIYLSLLKDRSRAMGVILQWT